MINEKNDCLRKFYSPLKKTSGWKFLGRIIVHFNLDQREMRKATFMGDNSYAIQLFHTCTSILVGLFTGLGSSAEFSRSGFIYLLAAVEQRGRKMGSSGRGV